MKRASTHHVYSHVTVLAFKWGLITQLYLDELELESSTSLIAIILQGTHLNQRSWALPTIMQNLSREKKMLCLKCSNKDDRAPCHYRPPTKWSQTFKALVRNFFQEKCNLNFSCNLFARSPRKRHLIMCYHIGDQQLLPIGGHVVRVAGTCPA